MSVTTPPDVSAVDVPPAAQRSVTVALVGPSNSGKSTLTNRLVGHKVSIVTPKVQTTRTRVTGIFVRDTAQIVLVDTPGIFEPKRALDRAMLKAAWGSMREADYMALIIDAKKGICRFTEQTIEGMRQRGTPAVAILNKVDIVAKPKLLDLAIALQNALPFEQIFMISALKNQGCDDVAKWMASVAQPGPWPFAADQLTDMPEKLYMAEITREALMLRLNNELPYQLAVQTDTLEDKGAKGIVVHQTILVTNDRHKGILLGKGGSMIRDVGAASRKTLMAQFDAPVHLYLHVKVISGQQDALPLD